MRFEASADDVAGMRPTVTAAVGRWMFSVTAHRQRLRCRSAVGSASAWIHTGWVHEKCVSHLLVMFRVDLDRMSAESPPLWVHHAQLRLLQALVRRLPEGARGGAPAHFQVQAAAVWTCFQANTSFGPVASNSPAADCTARTVGTF